VSYLSIQVAGANLGLGLIRELLKHNWMFESGEGFRPEKLLRLFSNDAFHGGVRDFIHLDRTGASEIARENQIRIAQVFGAAVCHRDASGVENREKNAMEIAIGFLNLIEKEN
jgi:hypothetical protein